MCAVLERSFHLGARLECSAYRERLDDGASQLWSHVVRKPEDACHVEFQLFAGGAQLFQALAVVHRNACYSQAVRRLPDFNPMLLQQLMSCRSHKVPAARV